MDSRDYFIWSLKVFEYLKQSYHVERRPVIAECTKLIEAAGNQTARQAKRLEARINLVFVEIKSACVNSAATSKVNKRAEPTADI